MATAASALPSATAEVAGACPVTEYGLTVAGQLAEIRAGDLAFTIAEAGLLMAQHGITLPGRHARVPHRWAQAGSRLQVS